MTLALKSKSEIKSKAKSAAAEQAAVVDRLAEIAKKLAKLDPLLKEKAELEKGLREAAEDVAPDEIVTFEGTDFNFVLSAQREERRITDMKMVRKLMGNETFMEVAKVTLKDIDNILSGEEREKVLESGRTGSRTGKLVPK